MLSGPTILQVSEVLILMLSHSHTLETLHTHLYMLNGDLEIRLVIQEASAFESHPGTVDGYTAD